MSVAGHLLCKRCGEWITLGRWVHDEESVGQTFMIPTASEAELGTKALRFLARHLHHGILVAPDDVVFDMADLDHFDMVDSRYLYSEESVKIEAARKRRILERQSRRRPPSQPGEDKAGPNTPGTNQGG